MDERDMNKVQITLNDGYEFSRAEVDIGSTYVLPSSGLKPRDGQEFLGWYTLPDGGEQVSRVRASKSDTYYARYGIFNCTLTFIDDYSNFRQEMEVQHGSTPSQFPVLRRSGYRFVGWRWASDESSDMSSEMEVTESLQVYSDMTFHAHWEAINYRVEWYFLNCANQSEEADFRRDFAGYNPSLTLPETRNLAERDSIIDDIILANREWTALLDDVGRHGIHGWQVARWEVVEPNFDLEDGAYTIKCYWKKAIYNIVFKSEGTVLKTLQRSYGQTIRDAQFTQLPSPNKEGYTYQGWKCNGQSVTLGTEVKGNMVIEPIWERQKVTVRFDPQGGSFRNTGSSVYEIRVDYGTLLSTVANRPQDPEKLEWHFMGWCTDPNGNGSKQEVQNILVKPTYRNDGLYDVISYYAIYQHNYWDITFDANGGTFSVVSSNQFTEDTIKPPAVPPEKQGYRFGGWYKTKTDQTEQLKSTDLVTGRATYYAKWLEDEIDITFNSNGGH